MYRQLRLVNGAAEGVGGGEDFGAGGAEEELALADEGVEVGDEGGGEEGVVVGGVAAVIRA